MRMILLWIGMLSVQWTGLYVPTVISAQRISFETSSSHREMAEVRNEVWQQSNLFQHTPVKEESTRIISPPLEEGTNLSITVRGTMGASKEGMGMSKGDKMGMMVAKGKKASSPTRSIVPSPSPTKCEIYNQEGTKGMGMGMGMDKGGMGTMPKKGMGKKGDICTDTPSLSLSPSPSPSPSLSISSPTPIVRVTSYKMAYFSEGALEPTDDDYEALQKATEEHFAQAIRLKYPNLVDVTSSIDYTEYIGPTGDVDGFNIYVNYYYADFKFEPNTDIPDDSEVFELMRDSITLNAGVDYILNSVRPISAFANTIAVLFSGLDISTLPPSTNASASDTIEILVTAYRMAYLAEGATEPTDEEYKALQQATEDHFAQAIRLKYPNLVAVTSSVEYTLFAGPTADVDGFNIYMNYYYADFKFEPNTDVPTDTEIFELMKDSVSGNAGVDYILNSVHPISAFANTMTVLLSDLAISTYVPTTFLN